MGDKSQEKLPRDAGLFYSSRKESNMEQAEAQFEF